MAARSSIRKVRAFESAGRGQFGEEDGGAQPERRGNEESQKRGDHRAVNERQRPEILRDRIPLGGSQEPPAELVAGRDGAGPKLVNQQHGHHQDAGGEGERHPTGDHVARLECVLPAAGACTAAAVPMLTGYLTNASCFNSRATTSLGSGA